MSQLELLDAKFFFIFREVFAWFWGYISFVVDLVSVV